MNSFYVNPLVANVCNKTYAVRATICSSVRRIDPQRRHTVDLVLVSNELRGFGASDDESSDHGFPSQTISLFDSIAEPARTLRRNERLFL
jgi:Uri superfamily endonuclease